MVFGDGKMTADDWGGYETLWTTLCNPDIVEEYNLEFGKECKVWDEDDAKAFALKMFLKPRLKEKRLFRKIANEEINEELGFIKCLHLCLNFPKEYDIDNIKKNIQILQNWEVSWLRGAKFVVEFWSNSGYNPHIHIWLHYVAPSIVRGACKKKFEFNCWVGKGHKNLLSYVEGTKRIDKEANLEKDQKTRELASIDNTYILE